MRRWPYRRMVALAAATAVFAGAVTGAIAQSPVRLDIAVDPAVTEADWVAALVVTPLDGGVSIASVTPANPPSAPAPKAKSQSTPASKPAPSMSASKAVRLGKVALAVLPLEALAGTSSLYAFEQIPFLGGHDGSRSRVLLDAARPFLDQRLREDGLVLLAIVPTNPVMLVLTEPPGNTLAGYRIGTGSAASRRAAELAGLLPVNRGLPQQSANAAFKSTFDRTDAAGRTAIPDTPAAYPAWQPHAILVAHAATWQKLEPDQRAAVQRVATATQRRSPPPSPAFQQMPHAITAGLEKVGWQMAAEWAIATGADGVAIIEAVRSSGGGQ